MPLNILQCTEQPHTAKNDLAQMSTVLAGAEKPWLRTWGLYLNQQHWRAYKGSDEAVA